MIKKIDEFKLKYSIQSVEDLLNDIEGYYTLLKIIEEYRAVINATVDVANEGLNLLEWCKDVGVPDKVIEIMEQYATDGTLEDLININKYNELDSRVAANENDIAKNTADISTLNSSLTSAINTINTNLNSKVAELQTAIATGDSSLDEKITTKYNELITKIKDEFSSNQINTRLQIEDRFQNGSFDIDVVPEYFELYSENIYGGIKGYINNGALNINGVVNRIADTEPTQDEPLAYYDIRTLQEFKKGFPTCGYSSDYLSTQNRVLTVDKQGYIYFDEYAGKSNPSYGKFIMVNLSLPFIKERLPYGLTSYTTQVANINSKQNKNTFTFVHVPDVHTNCYYAKNIDSYDGGVERLINWVGSATNSSFICYNGDIWGEDLYYNGQLTKAQMSKNYTQLRQMTNGNSIFTWGNHDDNSEKSLLKDKVIRDREVWDILMNGKTNIIPADGELYGKFMYYMDDNTSKIRFIILNSSELTYENGSNNNYLYGGIGHFHFSNAQIEWLKKCLVVPHGYGVVVLSHCQIYPTIANSAINSNSPYNCDKLHKVLEDFKAGGGDLIACFHGHCHQDLVFDYNGIKHISTTTVCNGNYKDCATENINIDTMVIDRELRKIYTFRMKDVTKNRVIDY